MNPYAIIHQTQALRVSDGMTRALLENCESAPRTLVLVWSQLGDFDTLEYAWWFQRPFELATLRLRNMVEVLGNWKTYVPNPAYLTQRGGTFLFDSGGKLLYEHRDTGILGFAANMSHPLSFLL
jgi:hypothetical protein